MRKPTSSAAVKGQSIRYAMLQARLEACPGNERGLRSKAHAYRSPIDMPYQSSGIDSDDPGQIIQNPLAKKF